MSAGAPKGNKNAETWDLSKRDNILNDIISKIKSREVQYLSDLLGYFNLKSNSSSDYILRKLNIKEEVKNELKKYKPNRDSLFKNKNRGCRIKRNKLKTRYITKRRNEDSLFKLTHNFKVLFRYHFKNKNGNHTFNVLDYTVNDLKVHLESLFDDKMNWDNYGSYWHIDHIKPASLFNHSVEKELKECWSLSNLQPLDAISNMSKGNRYYE